MPRTRDVKHSTTQSARAGESPPASAYRSPLQSRTGDGGSVNSWLVRQVLKGVDFRPRETRPTRRSWGANTPFDDRCSFVSVPKSKARRRSRSRASDYSQILAANDRAIDAGRQSAEAPTCRT